LKKSQDNINSTELSSEPRSPNIPISSRFLDEQGDDIVSPMRFYRQTPERKK